MTHIKKTLAVDFENIPLLFCPKCLQHPKVSPIIFHIVLEIFAKLSFYDVIFCEFTMSIFQIF